MAIKYLTVAALSILLSLAVADFHVCCPTCSTFAIDSLNQDQIQQIENNSAFIREIEDNPLLLHEDAYQREVVSLTSQQEEQMLRNFPQMFMSQETFAQSQLTSGTITVPGTNTTRRRRAVSLRVCEPVRESNPLILVNEPSGQVVQLGQPSRLGNQWILKESCDTTVSPRFASGQQCGLVERHVPAVFINLSEVLNNGGSSKDFDFAYVVVQSCVTLLL